MGKELRMMGRVVVLLHLLLIADLKTVVIVELMLPLVPQTAALPAVDE